MRTYGVKHPEDRYIPSPGFGLDSRPEPCEAAPHDEYLVRLQLGPSEADHGGPVDYENEREGEDPDEEPVLVHRGPVKRFD